MQDLHLRVQALTLFVACGIVSGAVGRGGTGTGVSRANCTCCFGVAGHVVLDAALYRASQGGRYLG